MTLDQIRAQYPQYKDLPDGELAYRLWNKSYKDKLPMGEFADSIDLSNDGFSQMIRTARKSGYEPTAITSSEGAQPSAGGLRNFLQGQTFGFSDEIIGGLDALGAKMSGDSRPLGDISRESVGYERAQLDQAGQASPWGSAGTQIAGALANPANLVAAPSALIRAAPALRAAVVGGAQGAAFGAGSGEGGVKERAEEAAEVGLASALFGVAGQQLFRLAGAGVRKLKDAVTRSNIRPSVETLRDVKNAAYDAVDQSGLKFSRAAASRLYANAVQQATRANYVPEVDKQTFAALKMMEAQLGKNLTVGELDKLRQGLYKRLGAAPNEVAIRGMIDGIDQLIDSLPATNSLMQAARLANSRYKKAELLETAFNRADLQTAATGSGGNILNKYRQAVASILNDATEVKWFNDVEKSQMEKFVHGSLSENSLRLLGKLSPSGNGLMMALNLGAAAVEPTMLAVTAGAAGAKAVADFSVKSGAEKLKDVIATGRIPTQIPYLPGIAPAVASTAAQESQ